MLAYRTNHHGKAAGPPIPELSARRRLFAFDVRRRRRGLDRSPCEISRRPFRAVFGAAAKSGARARRRPCADLVANLERYLGPFASGNSGADERAVGRRAPGSRIAN